jgi:AcrR family transcriptional regulator
MQNRILTEALHQMNVRGIKFTTAELARELGVSKRAIYEHFAGKEALMGAVFDVILADLRQETASIAQDESLGIIEKLRGLMIASPKALGPISANVIDDVKRFLPKEWRKFEDFFNDRWTKIEQLISKGVDSGVFGSVNLAVLHCIYMGTVDRLLEHHFLTQNNMTFKNAMNITADILILGLVAPDRDKTCTQL